MSIKRNTMYVPSKEEVKQARICAEQMNLAYPHCMWLAANAQGMTPCAIAIVDDNVVLQSQWINGNWIYIQLNVREWMLDDMVVYDYLHPSECLRAPK